MLFYGRFGFHYFFLKVVDILFQQQVIWLDSDLTPFSPKVGTAQSSDHVSALAENCFESAHTCICQGRSSGKVYLQNLGLSSLFRGLGSLMFFPLFFITERQQHFVSLSKSHNVLFILCFQVVMFCILCIVYS